MPFDFVEHALKLRRDQGLYREQPVIDRYDQQYVIVSGKRFVNFSGNDYLGLAQPPSGGNDNVTSGSSGSSVMTGHSRLHQRLCDQLAEQLSREAVMLFSSGFAANMGLCQALADEGKTRFLCDRLVHASMIDGMVASQAKFRRFAHNDVVQLAKHLDRHTAKTRAKNHETSAACLVLTESIFSMDGDSAPLKHYASMVSQHGAALYVDDAHGFGVMGEHGLGCVEHCELSQDQLPILMGTFGKAIGSAGAFVAGSTQLIDYLRNFGRHYVYSTALSPMQVSYTLSNLQRCQSQAWRRQKLSENIAQFKMQMADQGMALLPSNSPIQPVMIGDTYRATAIAERLRRQGFWVTAIRYPTVPKNTDRLRITLTSMHDASNINQLVTAISTAVAIDSERTIQ